MLHIHGREIPNLQIETPVEKHLYIDIDGNDLSAIYNLPPTSTYIISRRSLADLEELIAKGYMNISTIERNSQITARFISNFIATDYYDNSLIILSKRISELNASSGTEAKQLLDALVALRDDDVNTFVKLMSANLSGMISAINNISSMITFSKSLEESSAHYAETVKKATQYEQALAEVEKYRSLYESAKSDRIIASADKSDLQERIHSLQDKIESFSVSSEEVHNHADYKELETRIQTLTEERDKISADFESYKQDVEEQAALVKDSSKDSIIKHLRDELQKIQRMSYDQIISGRYPVLQDTTTLAAEHILYFKEVRPAIYINSMIQWINSFMRVRYENRQQKRYIILVLDPMIDQYTVAKYRKHNWSINTPLNDGEYVLVTNVFDYSKLKTMYHIDTYDCIVCIDRSHVLQDAITVKRCKKFYLINTTNDMLDFNLDPAYCIGFFDKAPPGAPQPRYRIKTWDDSLAVASLDRSGKFTKDDVFRTILKECGVIS